MRTASAVRALPHLLGHGIDLTWQNPPASEFTAGTTLVGIRIVRRERTYPLSIDDGQVVYPLDYAPLGPQFGPIISRFSDRRLDPLVRYYYTIFTVDNANVFYSDDGSRVSALAADDYVIDGESLVERLYKMLPAVHQRYDKLTAPELAQLPATSITALKALPPALHGRGPLWRFFRAAAAPLNVIRSSAEALRQLRDIDNAPPQFLPLLAEWLGWELDRTLPTYAQRNEVKFAPRLYRTVGSVPNLRAIVNRYTGWYSQAAEFAQSIVRSNVAPQLNLFAMTQSGATWRGTDDAAVVLGLTTPVDGVKGTPTTPATIVSANAAPFVLRPGMEIAITADNRIPVVVRFEPGDFNNIAAATAAEVAGVFNRALSEITAAAAGSNIQLRSNTIGADSAIRVEQYAASLVSLEDAPRGRLSVFTDNALGAPDHIRLFYETADPLAQANERLALSAFSGKPFPHGLSPEEREERELGEALEEEAARTEVESPWVPAVPQGRIRYKTFRSGVWGGSLPLPVTPGAAQTDPAATRVTMPDGSSRIFAAWIDKPNLPANAAPKLGFGTGNSQAAGGVGVSAQLDSNAAAPFALLPGMEVAVTIDQFMPVVVRFASKDFADITAATAAEVAQVFNNALFTAEVTPLADGRLRFSSGTTGPSSLVRFENEGRLRFALGTARAPLPARLVGQRSAPFNVQPGLRLILRGNFSEFQAVQFAVTDFANPQSATALEVVNALNARLSRAVASVQPNGTIALESLSSGGDERLEIDLQQSSAAPALGFTDGNHTAVGDWGDAIDWATPQDVTAAPPGLYADLFAVRAANGILWLFWSRFLGSTWRVEASRWNGISWTALEELAIGAGGNREPCAVVDGANRLWLFWSQNSAVDTWTLRRRVFQVGAWGAESSLTTIPAGATRVADREPGAVRLANGNLQIFFNSDRAGGPDLWSFGFQPSPPVISGFGAVTFGAAADYAPQPLLLGGGALWLLFRSDRSVPLSRVATHSLPVIDNRITTPTHAQSGAQSTASTSVRMSDAGTIRRFAGTTSVVLTDAARNSRSRQWDDLLSYTPQKPLGPPWEAPLTDDEYYTRGTVGLYLSQIIPDTPLSQQMIKRLLPALQRFLPINVRAVVVLAPRVDVEFVYGDGTEIDEKYLDKYPFIEVFAGVVEDLIRATLPDVSLLLSNTAGHVSANPANLPTLRRRTFSPPPQ